MPYSDEQARQATSFLLNTLCETYKENCDPDADPIDTFANEAGVNPATMRAFRDGTRVHPTRTEVEKLCDFLRTSFEQDALARGIHPRDLGAIWQALEQEQKV